MRLTNTLQAFRKGFWFKNIWRTKGKAIVPKAVVPPALESLGIKPIDPLEELFETERKKVVLHANTCRLNTV